MVDFKLGAGSGIKSAGGLVQYRFLGPTPEDPDAAGLG